MNRNELQRLASEWVRLAKNDIRNKVIDFMREVDASQRELAYVLAISEGELNQIIEGNGEITLSTFAKLLIATGNALEIKPIEDTPIGDYNNIPTDCEMRRQMPRPNIFERQRPPHSNSTPPTNHFGRPSFSRPIEEDVDEDYEFDSDEAPTEERYNMPPRDEHGRFMRRNQRYETNSPISPFDTMTTDELVKIIKERLWDSEINLNTATKSQLVSFLKEKDKRMKQYQRIKNLENDPKVMEFKSRMKKTLDENPHLREWAKKFLGGLND